MVVASLLLPWAFYIAESVLGVAKGKSLKLGEFIQLFLHSLLLFLLELLLLGGSSFLWVGYWFEFKSLIRL